MEFSNYIEKELRTYARLTKVASQFGIIIEDKFTRLEGGMKIEVIKDNERYRVAMNNWKDDGLYTTEIESLDGEEWKEVYVDDSGKIYNQEERRERLRRAAFAFMMPTPEFVQENHSGGQFNGYIAVHKDYVGEGKPYVGDESDCDWMHGGCTLCSLYNSTPWEGHVPVNGECPTDWSDYVIYGFDTLHCGDTWEEWDKHNVRCHLCFYMSNVKEAIL